MPVTKVCKSCQREVPIEELTCADTGVRVPDCKWHAAGAESIPGCDEIYCEKCWEEEPRSLNR